MPHRHPEPSTGRARLCVFDLDGTLADTAADLVGALNRVLAEEGLPAASFDEARAYVGHGARVLIERAHAAHGLVLEEARAVALTERFVAHYAADIAGGTVLFPGADAAMDRMAAAGWRFAVCTNKREGLARQLIAALGRTGRFAAITGGDTFGFRKPDGRHILETVALAGGSPGRALMVGDSGPDVQAARDAGVPVVAVAFGYSAGPVEALGADAVIGHFDALPALAERLVPAEVA